jgi:hypothetical protein
MIIFPNLYARGAYPPHPRPPLFPVSISVPICTSLSDETVAINLLGANITLPIADDWTDDLRGISVIIHSVSHMPYLGCVRGVLANEYCQPITISAVMSGFVALPTPTYADVVSKPFCWLRSHRHSTVDDRVALGIRSDVPISDTVAYNTAIPYDIRPNLQLRTLPFTGCRWESIGSPSLCRLAYCQVGKLRSGDEVYPSRYVQRCHFHVGHIACGLYYADDCEQCRLVCGLTDYSLVYLPLLEPAPNRQVQPLSLFASAANAISYTHSNVQTNLERSTNDLALCTPLAVSLMMSYHRYLDSYNCDVMSPIPVALSDADYKSVATLNTVDTSPLCRWQMVDYRHSHSCSSRRFGFNDFRLDDAMLD